MTNDTHEADPVDVVAADGRRGLKTFIHYPWPLYRNDPYWVAPLLIEQYRLFNPRKNPFLQHSEIHPFLAKRRGKVVGRVAAIVNGNYNRHHQVNHGFFGFFESINDQAVAGALFDHVRDWFAARDVHTVYGPMNPSINHECGLLVDGFDSSPAVIMTYNPRYYVDLYEGYGLTNVHDLWAYTMVSPDQLPRKVRVAAERARRTGKYTTRYPDLKHFREEARILHDLYNHAWSRNWGFCPMSEAEFEDTAKRLREVIVPELVVIAEHEGEPVAFMLAVPDINQALKHARGRLLPFGLLKILYHKRHIKRLRVVLMGMRREHAHSGVVGLLYAQFIQNGMRLGYHEAELSWILPENPLNRMLRALGAEVYKTYRVYEMQA